MKYYIPTLLFAPLLALSGLAVQENHRLCL